VSVKSKSGSLLATLAVVAVVVLGFQYLPPKVGQDDDKMHDVIITAIWLPSPRVLDGVQVEITIGNKLVHDKAVSAAPFQKGPYKVKRGDRVEVRLRVLGQSISTFLGCSIAVDTFEAVSEKINNRPIKAGDRLSCWTAV
jgi:hypothetical protein